MSIEANGQLETRKNSQDYLYWLMNQIFLRRGNPKQICGLAALLREINILLSDTPAENQRLSARLPRHLSDIAILAGIEHQLDLSFHTSKVDLDITPEELGAEIDAKFWQFREIRHVLFFPNGGNRRIDFSDFPERLRFVDYPSDKPPSAINTQKMRKAELNLDQFFKYLDNALVAGTGKGLVELEGESMTNRTIRRTPEWVEPSPVATIAAKSSMETLPESLPLLKLEQRSSQFVDEQEKLPPKTKTKTRCQPTNLHESEDSNSQENEHSTAQEPAGERIPVSNKVLRAFSALFHLPLTDAIPGQLPWKEFVHAMSHVGFSAESITGSAWVFKRTDKYPSEKIIFHEPHPDSKIPPPIAKWIARRLQRTFGWTAETFVRANEASGQNIE